MSYGDNQQKFPFWPLLIGFIIGGAFVRYMVLHDIEYRVSFYGFKQKNGELVPLIKLRKTVKGSTRPFAPKDWGKEIEIGELNIPSNGGSMRFTDNQMQSIIKESYCG